jgi:hypothetical protein
VAMDFSIFRGHSGQQAGHQRPVAAVREPGNEVAVAAAKFEACK